jgi:hypothetical protein
MTIYMDDIRGNLAVRSLAGVVKKDDCVLGSEYMQSIFVAVPRQVHVCIMDAYRNAHYDLVYFTRTGNKNMKR